MVLGNKIIVFLPLIWVPLLCHGQVTYFLPKYYECLAQGKYWSGACPSYRSFVIDQIQKRKGVIYVKARGNESTIKAEIITRNGRHYWSNIRHMVGLQSDRFRYSDTSVEYVDCDTLIKVIAHYPSGKYAVDFVSKFGQYKVEYVEDFLDKLPFIGTYKLNEQNVTFNLDGTISNHELWRKYSASSLHYQHTLNGKAVKSKYGDVCLNIVTKAGKKLTFACVRRKNKLYIYKYAYTELDMNFMLISLVYTMEMIQ